MQHDYFSSSNQSYHTFLSLSLLSSLLKFLVNVAILGIDAPVVHGYGDVGKLSVREDKKRQK